MWWNHEEVHASKQEWQMEVWGIGWKRVIMKDKWVSRPMTWKGWVIVKKEMMSPKRKEIRANCNTNIYLSIVLFLFTIYVCFLTFFSYVVSLNAWSYCRLLCFVTNRVFLHAWLMIDGLCLIVQSIWVLCSAFKTCTVHMGIVQLSRTILCRFALSIMHMIDKSINIPRILEYICHNVLINDIYVT